MTKRSRDHAIERNSAAYSTRAPMHYSSCKVTRRQNLHISGMYLTCAICTSRDAKQCWRVCMIISRPVKLSRLSTDWEALARHSSPSNTPTSTNPHIQPYCGQGQNLYNRSLPISLLM